MRLRAVEPPPRVVILRRDARRLWTNAVEELLAGDTAKWSELRKEADALEAEARELDQAACRGVAKACTAILDWAEHDNAPRGAA